MEAWAIVAVIAILCGFGQQVLKSRGHRGNKAEAERLDALEQRLARSEQLEQRVQTLERIVTDRGYQLKDEIAELERSA